MVYWWWWCTDGGVVLLVVVYWCWCCTGGGDVLVVVVYWGRWCTPGGAVVLVLVVYWWWCCTGGGCVLSCHISLSCIRWSIVTTRHLFKNQGSSNTYVTLWCTRLVLVTSGLDDLYLFTFITRPQYNIYVHVTLWDRRCMKFLSLLGPSPHNWGTMIHWIDDRPIFHT